MSQRGFAVSVIVLTYNHASFIEQAIDSVLAQKTDFDVDVLVLEDGSTDGTQDVLNQKYAAAPSVQLLLADKNVGPKENGKRLFNLQLGKYIAFLDGDDYWSFEGKLQQQVDFLESHPTYAGAFHDATIRSEHGSAEKLSQKIGFRRYSQMFKYRDDYTMEDAIGRVIVPASTVVYRTTAFDMQEVMKLARFRLSGAWMQSLVVLRSGPLKYFNEEWSVYRDHAGGITKTKSSRQFNSDVVLFLEQLVVEAPYAPFKRVIFENINREYRYILHQLLAGKAPNSERRKAAWALCRYTCKQLMAEFRYFLKD